MLNFVLCDDNEIIVAKLSKMLESIFIKNICLVDIKIIHTFAQTKINDRLF